MYVSQLNPGGTHDTFYTDEGGKEGYRNYVREFVGRYLDEEGVMAWELANEPRWCVFLFYLLCGYLRSCFFFWILICVVLCYVMSDMMWLGV